MCLLKIVVCPFFSSFLVFFVLLFITFSVSPFFPKVDSGPTQHAAVVSSPGAQGVTCQDGGEASGGGRNSAGEQSGSGGGSSAPPTRHVGAGNVPENGSESRREATPVPRKSAAAAAAAVRIAGSTEGEPERGGRRGRSRSDSESSSDSENEEPLFVRPPPAEGVSGGYAAPQA